MAVFEAYLRDKQGASETPNDSDFVDVWIAKCDNVADDHGTVASSPLVPAYGSQHGTYTAYRVSKREIRNQDKARPILAEVVLTYSRNFDVAKLEAKEIDPLQRDMEVTRESQEIDVAMLTDAITGEILRNKAGDIITGQTTKCILRIYRVTVNVDSLVPFESLAGKVNSTPVSIWGENWGVHMVRLAGAPKYHSKRSDFGTTYYRCTYEVVCDPRTHDLKILNAGFNELINGTQRPIKVEGQDITQPVPLDSNGKRIPAAILNANPVTVPVILTFARFEEADLNVVPLPSSVT